MGNYREEFPDFDPATLPEMPLGFEDVSWHNEACPAFHCEALRMSVFIDYANPEMREWPEEPRFHVFKTDADGARIEDADEFFADDWGAVLAFIQAEAP